MTDTVSQTGGPANPSLQDALVGAFLLLQLTRSARDQAGDILAEAIDTGSTIQTTAGNVATQVGQLATLAAQLQAQLGTAQPLDATLTGLAAVTTAANKLIYATAADTFAATDLSVFARSVLDDIDGPSMLATLGALALAGGTMTGPLILQGDPSAALGAATKQYVDAAIQGLDPKQSVRAASTANLTLSGAQTVDGVALVAGDRVLVKNQSAAAQNGIYVVASGSWARATDMDAWAEVPGAFLFVEQGTANADTAWVCTSDQGGTLGTTAVAFVQFGSLGGLAAIASSGSASDLVAGTVPNARLPVNVAALAALTGAANSVPVFTAAGAMALLLYGTSGANALLQLDSTGKLPALDGSQLTNLPASTSGVTMPVNAQTSAYTIVSGDAGKLIDCTGSFAVTLPGASAFGAGKNFAIRNSGTGIVSLARAGSDLIDGLTALTLYPTEAFSVDCTGSAFKSIGRSQVVLLNAFSVGSAVSSVDIETGFADPELGSLRIQFDGVVFSTTSDGLVVLAKQGGSYVSDTNYYSLMLNQSASATASNTANAGSGTTVSISANAIPNTTSVSGHLEAFHPYRTGASGWRVEFATRAFASGGTNFRNTGDFGRIVGGALQGLSVRTNNSGQTINAGTFRVYGRRGI